MSRIYFTITGTNHHYGQEFFEPKMSVRLVKEPDNEVDAEAIKVELEGLDLEGFDFFGMAEDLPVDGNGSGGSGKELTGTTEIDAEVFGDEEFKYECPNCGFRFN